MIYLLINVYVSPPIVVHWEMFEYTTHIKLFSNRIDLFKIASFLLYSARFLHCYPHSKSVKHMRRSTTVVKAPLKISWTDMNLRRHFFVCAKYDEKSVSYIKLMLGYFSLYKVGTYMISVWTLGLPICRRLGTVVIFGCLIFALALVG